MLTMCQLTYRFSVKINTDFARYQDNSLEEGVVRSLWNDLFLYKAQDLPKDITYSQKNEILRVFCDMFMVSACTACMIMIILHWHVYTCCKKSVLIYRGPTWVCIIATGWGKP